MECLGERQQAHVASDVSCGRHGPWHRARWTAALLATTCLTFAAAALADGGQGGSAGGTGGTGMLAKGTCDSDLGKYSK